MCCGKRSEGFIIVLWKVSCTLLGDRENGEEEKVLKREIDIVIVT